MIKAKIINKIISNIEKELKKPNGYRSGQSLFELYNNTDKKKMTTYSKEVRNTKLDPRLKGGKEYGKTVRYLTKKEIRELKQTDDLGISTDASLINKNQKIQRYMDRKRRQV